MNGSNDSDKSSSSSCSIQEEPPIPVNVWETIDATPTNGRCGVPGDFFYTEIAPDHPLLSFKLERTVINCIGNCGYQAGESGARVEINYQQESSSKVSDEDLFVFTKKFLARKCEYTCIHLFSLFFYQSSNFSNLFYSLCIQMPN